MESLNLVRAEPIGVTSFSEAVHGDRRRGAWPLTAARLSVVGSRRMIIGDTCGMRCCGPGGYADEDRQGRRFALRRRLAGQFVFEGHHRRGHRRLVGIYGGLWRARADRGHLEARRALLDRAGPAAGRAAQPPSLRRDKASCRRGQSDGDRGDRERAGRHQGQGIGRASLRDAGRTGARPITALLVALRHLSRAPCRQDP